MVDLRVTSTGTFQAISNTFAAALAAGEIFTVFQPKVALATRELIGVEALARWHSPVHGVVKPEVFVSVAEEQGLIDVLTQIVLRDALDACALLRRHADDITMAINVSPVLLSDPQLPLQIDRALMDAGVPPSAFIVEITEGRMIHDIKRAGIVLAALRQRGIGCAIDDFGTGHASLLTLLRLPFSELKIDRAFITRCATDREAQMIVRATLGLAHEMNLHVVAEGIETVEAETTLRNLGCASGQGFRYSLPIDAASLLANFSHSGRNRWISDVDATDSAPPLGVPPRKSPGRRHPTHERSTIRADGKNGEQTMC